MRHLQTQNIVTIHRALPCLASEANRDMMLVRPRTMSASYAAWCLLLLSALAHAALGLEENAPQITPEPLGSFLERRQVVTELLVSETDELSSAPPDSSPSSQESEPTSSTVSLVEPTNVPPVDEFKRRVYARGEQSTAAPAISTANK